jgi:hypothetical protein
MGLQRGPLAADIVGQSAARTTESAQPCGMGSSGQARVKWQPAASGRGRRRYLWHAILVCSAEGENGTRGNDSGAVGSTLWKKHHDVLVLYVCMQRHVRAGSRWKCWQSVSRQRCLHGMCSTCFTPDRRTLKTPYRSPDSTWLEAQVAPRTALGRRLRARVRANRLLQSALHPVSLCLSGRAGMSSSTSQLAF